MLEKLLENYNPKQRSFWKATLVGLIIIIIQVLKIIPGISHPVSSLITIGSFIAVCTGMLGVVYHSDDDRSRKKRKIVLISIFSLFLLFIFVKGSFFPSTS